MVEMANVELALAHKDFAKALLIIEALQAQIPSTIRADIPEVLWHKGEILRRLGQVEEARQVLHQALTMAEGMVSRQSLWRIFALLAEIESKAGDHTEAGVLKEKACENVSFIADHLQPLGFKELYLRKPDVKAVLDGRP